jgi:hypothetical protein
MMSSSKYVDDCCSVISCAGYLIPQSYLKHIARLLMQLFPEAVKIMPTLRQLSFNFCVSFFVSRVVACAKTSECQFARVNDLLHAL